MTALLASDLYRAVRSRWLWVALGLVALVQVGTAVSVFWWPLDPTLVFDGLTGHAGALRLAGRGMSVEGVAIVAAFVAAHLSCADSCTGFDRTLLSSLRGRAGYFAEKYLFVALLTAAVLLAYLALSGIGVLVVGVPVRNVEPLWQVAAWVGCEWLVACAYALLVTLVGQLSRSRALAFVLALMLTTGLAEQVVYGFVVLLGGIFGLGPQLSPGLELAFGWAPYVTSRAVAHGAAELLAADATGVAPALRALAVCGPLVLLAIAAGTLVGSRRDLA